MPKTSREPRLVERGRQEVPEHGLGAGLSIGRLSRVRPSLRILRQEFPAKQGGTASNFVALEFSGAIFSF